MLLAAPCSLMTQAQVVSSADLQSELIRSGETRRHNLQTIQRFLSSPRAEKALASAHINGGQVQAAVSTLSDEELAQLASRVNKAQADFAGGRLSDREVILIALAIIALTLVIIVAAH